MIPIIISDSILPSKNRIDLNLTDSDYFPPDDKGGARILANWGHQEDEASLFHAGVVAFCAE